MSGAEPVGDYLAVLAQLVRGMRARLLNGRICRPPLSRPLFGAWVILCSPQGPIVPLDLPVPSGRAVRYPGNRYAPTVPPGLGQPRLLGAAQGARRLATDRGRFFGSLDSRWVMRPGCVLHMGPCAVVLELRELGAC